MPTIEEAQNVDMSGYERIDKTNPLLPTPPSSEPGYPVWIRCPAPPILLGSNPDSLRQYYQGGGIPQFRFLNIQGNNGNGKGNTVINQFGTAVGGGSGSSTIKPSPTPTPIPPKPTPVPVPTNSIASVTFTTSPLAPSGTYQTQLIVKKCAQIVSAVCSSAARVRLYGSAIEQAGDIIRDVDSPPPAGTALNIVTDVALDVAPFIWFYQNRVFTNGENPQRDTMYATIDNLGASTFAITVTLNYLPLTNS
jgi:hypothetical protein